MFSHDCKKYGHRFVERREEEINQSAMEEILPRVVRAQNPNALRNLYVIDRYVHDICVRCGEIRGRDDSTEEAAK